MNDDEEASPGERYAGLAADVVRLASLATGQSATGSAADGPELEDGLRLVPGVQRSVDHAKYQLITLLRRQRVTWERIANALDLRTPQAAQSQYDTLRRRFRAD